MKAPNMATITASLERSLQNCSLNHHHHRHHQQQRQRQRQSRGVLGERGERSSSSDDVEAEADAEAPQLPEQNHLLPNSDTTLELNSHLSLPYHWEQCLDLKVAFLFKLIFNSLSSLIASINADLLFPFVTF